MRPAIGAQCDDLAVQDQRMRFRRGHDVDHFRDCWRDGLQAARKYPHLGSQLVRLDAGAVELPLERGGSEAGDRLGGIARRLRQHG
jgi:hypothetical protein